MDWESLIENCIKEGFLDPDSAGIFKKNILSGNISKKLQEEGIDINYIAYNFLRFGYCKIFLDDTKKKELNSLKSMLRGMDSELIKNVCGQDKKYIQDKIDIMTKAANVYKCPLQNMVSIVSKKGRIISWQISSFVNFLYPCLKEKIENKGDIKELMVQIMYYFPPWKSSRKFGEDEDDINYRGTRAWDNIRKYIKKDQAFEKLYSEDKISFHQKYG